MGQAYWSQGPWLDADPLLFTAEGPPAPAAWGSAWTLHAIERAVGLQGLRGFHALLVAGILALAWSALRRASASARFASAGTALFAAVAAYRLFQLRPHLASLIGCLLLAHWFLREGPPSRRRIAALAVLFGIWANAHGAVLVGLGLLGAATAGAAWGPNGGARARRLALALVVSAGAACLNPAGPGLFLPFFAAGGSSPALDVVSDEWIRFPLFALPQGPAPPQLLEWLAVWALLVAVPLLTFRALRASRGERGAARPDPALLAVAAAAALGVLGAVRLVWLSFFPLLALGLLLRLRTGEGPPRAPLRTLSAVAAICLLPAFVTIGSWPRISQGISPTRYAEPYPALKFHAHGVWFLRDAGLEGRIWNDYQSGNFLGAWLAPAIQGFVNGSLNVPREVWRDGSAIRARLSPAGPADFLPLLDRYDLDLFFATGLPVHPPRNPLHPPSTTHLERAPGWILIFRNVRTSIYLRRHPRNGENLERVAGYYAERGVPFDPERGLQAGLALREAPEWAHRNGLLPADHRALLETVGSGGGSLRARSRLASIHALLGLYAEALSLDEATLERGPETLPVARRRLWCLLRAGRLQAAGRAAGRLERLAPPGDTLSQVLVARARDVARAEAESVEAHLAGLPLLGRAALAAVLAGFENPEAREIRFQIKP